MSLGLLPLFGLLIAQIVLKAFLFAKRFIKPKFLLSLEDSLIEYCDRCLENLRSQKLRSNMEYTFRPYELQKVNYRKPEVTNYPKPRSGHRIAASDKAIYLFGGFNPNMGNLEENELGNCMFKELWRFDLLSKTWTLILGEKSNLPVELASHAMCLYGDYLMIYGGTGYPFATKVSNKVHVWRTNDPTKDVEEFETTGEKPPPQYGQAIIMHKHYLYTVGGTDGFSYTCDVHRLNLLTREWELAYLCRQDINQDDPEPRYRHELAYDGKYLYVIGGGTSVATFSLRQIPAFDLDANVWVKITTKPDPKMNQGYPTSRKCHSCSQYGSNIVIAGGNNSRKAFRDIWKLSLETGQWTCIMSGQSIFYSPLFFHDSSIDNDGCMYIFGGIKLRNNTNIRTSVLQKMWITIPSLKAICWEAINFYCPRLREIDRDTLLRMGIPVEFVARIT
ncbi:kelch domain-containing protein 10 homolog [Culicoides brevitarsis]|uniref:kelch domain-containing protein 10 homolog n=1 Tax=Culicoides brevitarsis TaxID=469753 RepID=UPI00307C6262